MSRNCANICRYATQIGLICCSGGSWISGGRVGCIERGRKGCKQGRENGGRTDEVSMALAWTGWEKKKLPDMYQELQEGSLSGKNASKDVTFCASLSTNSQWCSFFFYITELLPVLAPLSLTLLSPTAPTSPLSTATVLANACCRRGVISFAS